VATAFEMNEELLELATQLDFLFGKGTFDEKRLICETVFKRLYVKEGRVTKAELNASFAIIAASAKGSGAVTSGGPYGTVPEPFLRRRN